MPSPDLVDWSCPGFRIERDADPPTSLKISAARPQPWVTFEATKQQGSIENMMHPTAILYGGESWRVLCVMQTKAGWVYQLDPWPPGEMRRQSVELHPEALSRDTAAKSDFQRRQSLAHYSVWYGWLVGFLPARIQRQMEDRLEIDAEGATAFSGQLELRIGMLFGAVGTIMMIGGKDIAGMVPGVIGLFMALEGVARWVWGKSDKACGTLPLEVLDWVYCKVMGRG